MPRLLKPSCWVLIALLMSKLAAFSQKSIPTSYQDYSLVTNLDSLEQVVHTLKNNPQAYLHGLITLEKNRTDYANLFGTELPTIDALAKQQHDPLATAAYHYLLSLSVKDNNLGAACRHILEAIRYFEIQRDTTGMLTCYYSLLAFNANSGAYKINKMQNRDYYYDRMMALGQASTDPFDKLMRIRAILSFEKLVKGTQDFAKSKVEVENALQLMARYPNTEPIWPNMYVSIASLYQRHNQNQAALTYGLKSYGLFKKKSAKPCVNSYYNTGASYHAIGNYKEAEPLLTEVVSILEQAREAKYNLLINAYSLLSEIQYRNKHYELAWAIRQKLDLLHLKRYSSLKVSLFEELQIQYDIDQKNNENRLLIEKAKLAQVNNQRLRQETKIRLLIERNKLAESRNLSYQKEVENHLLAQKNQSMEASNKQYERMLLIAAFAFCVVSVLIYLVYRANVKQKQLMVLRDQLYTIIAHDLREPINSLTGVGTLLRYLIRHNRSEEVEKVTQQIDLMGQQTSLLLNNLLEWGKHTYFEQQSHSQQLDATPLLTELTQVYAVQAQAKGMAMSVTIPDVYPLTANPKDLALIIRNLLDNALKNTPNGGRVELIANAERALIQVWNTGIGIAPDQLAYLGQVFAGKRKPEIGTHGLGLGLVLIADFAKKNNIRMQVSSQAEEGTTFSMLLPKS